jgi:hypothetical protein
VPRVAIPGGVWHSDQCRTDGPLRELGLRPVGGEDEAFLLETVETSPPSERATALLARCLDDTGGSWIARALTVGDREALLLHLRRLTLGETLDCVLQCPGKDCGERMELELRVSNLLVPAYADVRREYRLKLDVEGARYDVSFRLPTAADLDHAASLARMGTAQGTQAFLARCIVSATRDALALPVDSLPSPVGDAISSAMAEFDPQAEIDLDLACPSCGASFSIVFDTAMFFLQELDERAAHLTHEVHTLAWNYHWSEREILQMSRRRRARYLELVVDAVARSKAQ